MQGDAESPDSLSASGTSPRARAFATVWVVVIAIVGLGSNLGDRLAAIEAAIHALARTPQITLEAVSSVYETPALGPPQPAYLNAAVRIETALAPEALMEALLAIEASLGRVRREKWGPRTIDLDVLVLLDRAGGSILPHAGPKLIAPHPHLCERSFALAPLLEIAPELERPLRPVLEALGGPPPKAQSSPSGP